VDAIVIPSQYDINAIIEGYAKGYFMMSDDDGHGLGWYSSRQRTLIPLDDRFRYPKSLRRVLINSDFKPPSAKTFKPWWMAAPNVTPPGFPMN